MYLILERNASRKGILYEKKSIKKRCSTVGKLNEHLKTNPHIKVQIYYTRETKKKQGSDLMEAIKELLFWWMLLDNIALVLIKSWRKERIDQLKTLDTKD